MSDYTISSVSRVGQENPEPAVAARREESRPVEKKSEPPVEAKSADTGSQSAAFTSIRVQFQVDEETSDVVIFIRDSQTDRVLRTIPADAIKDLPPGQLMDMFF